MAEFIKFIKPKLQNVVTKNRFLFYIISHLLNINLYVFILIYFDSIFIKLFSFLIFQDILYQMLVKTLKLRDLNVSALVFGVIIFITFPFKSFIFLYTMLTILCNFLYFKYIINTQCL